MSMIKDLLTDKGPTVKWLVNEKLTGQKLPWTCHYNRSGMYFEDIKNWEAKHGDQRYIGKFTLPIFIRGVKD